jgi:hypothetical protein
MNGVRLTIADFCENGTENAGSIKDEEFLD